MNGLCFDPETHTYYYDGQKVPGVSEILKEAGIIPSSPFYTEEGRIRGKYVHEACQLFDEGDLKLDSLDPVLVPFVNGYRRFIKECAPQWEGIEERVYHKELQYAGTLDRRGVLSGRAVVLDIKTGVVSAWAALQTAGYTLCCPSKHERYALQLKPNGTYKLHHLAGEADEEAFKSAVSIYKWKEKNGKPLSSKGDGTENLKGVA